MHYIRRSFYTECVHMRVCVSPIFLAVTRANIIRTFIISSASITERSGNQTPVYFPKRSEVKGSWCENRHVGMAASEVCCCCVSLPPSIGSAYLRNTSTSRQTKSRCLIYDKCARKGTKLGGMTLRGFDATWEEN